ncbi:unnamed protein product [Boreogadus saida]
MAAAPGPTRPGGMSYREGVETSGFSGFGFAIRSLVESLLVSGQDRSLQCTISIQSEPSARMDGCERGAQNTTGQGATSELSPDTGGSRCTVPGSWRSRSESLEKKDRDEESTRKAW